MYNTARENKSNENDALKTHFRGLEYKEIK